MLYQSRRTTKGLARSADRAGPTPAPCPNRVWRTESGQEYWHAGGVRKAAARRAEDLGEDFVVIPPQGVIEQQMFLPDP